MLHQQYILIAVIFFGVLTTVNCEIKVSRVAPRETPYYGFNMMRDIKPTHYHIDIELDDRPNFFEYYNGTSVIRFRSNVESNFMAFHLNLSEHIVVHEICLVNLNTSVMFENFNVTYFEDGTDALIGLEYNAHAFLEPNTIYSLVVRYTVEFLENKREGLFKYCYNENEVELNCFITSYFESYRIRDAMPSFDNATLKAHFNVIITHPSSMQAISNMPVQTVDRRVSKTKTTFEETPLMSTYLLAITIGKFEWTTIDNLSNISMVLYAPVGIVKSTLIQKYAGPLLYAFEKYLNRSYSLPKLDFLVTHASSDNVQVTENWGLISLDETNLLATRNIEHVIKVIGHAIVHQFIGSVVSQKELRSRWLKEGLTTHFTALITGVVLQNVEYGDYLVTMNLATSILLEDLGKSVVLNDYTIHTKQFQKQVINSKGGAFSNMISHLVEARNYQNFIQNLINKFEFGSISTDDFISELQSVNNVEHKIPADIDIAAFINSWINQEKFPILTVSRNYDRAEIELSQNGNWWIPYNYATQSAPNFGVTTADGWIKNVPTVHIVVPNLKSGDWIVFNKHATGYYIVNYDVRNWNLIGDFLSSDDFEIIPAVDRAKLLLDVTLLNNADLVSNEILYKIMDLLEHDHSYAVWAIVNKYRLSSNNFENYMVENGVELITHVYNYYDGPEHGDKDSALIKITREFVVELACQLDFDKCHRDMQILATKFANQLDISEESSNFDIKQFKMICQYGIKTNDNFEKILTKVYLSRSKLIQEIFYNFLDSTTNLTSFYKYFVASVYSLPLQNNDELKFNADMLAIGNFNDIEILNSCILNNCYDFKMTFRNRADRFEILYSTVELALVHMDRPRFVNENDATIHELLRNIDAIYGGDIGDRIRSIYDVNSPRFNNGHYFGPNKMLAW